MAQVTILKCFFLASLALASSSIPPHYHRESIFELPSDEAKTFRVPSPGFRLPTSFVPSHYDLKIRPILDNLPIDLPQWSAPGSVTILGTCVNATTNITLHSEVTSVDESSVKVLNVGTNAEVPIASQSNDAAKTFYIIVLQEALQVGQEYSISIDYVAAVSTDSMEGLYRSHYDDPITGETKYVAATQFQAFAARRAFPSFDEPGLKATFKTTLGRRSNYTALCNTPLISSTPIPDLEEGWFWDEFEVTVPMPTYLVAIIISDFGYAEASPDIYSKPVRTYGPKYLLDNGYGEVAAEIAAKTLSFFEQFFDVEYALAKMDSVGLMDFAAGAMENWGLNIYRETGLLYNAVEQNNEKDRRGVALTLNHELAHQWAGNLVTLDWWTMAWVNEGFATYLSYHGMNYTNPEYEPRKAFQYDCIQNAMKSDVLNNSHPTVLPDDGTPWEIMGYSANLVYSKGAALLRMMEGFLTLETLQKGLQTFMKQYSFKSANQDQFFEIVTTQAVADGRLPTGVTVKDIMDTWTLQRRFPLVKVTISGNSVVITQEEYKPDNENKIYYIPLAIATQSNPDQTNEIPQYWLYDETNVQIDHNPLEWIIVNSGATGYYRVEYDEVLTELLQAQLVSDHEVISLGSRTQLIDDYFTFAFDRRSGIETALGFTKYLSKETEFSAWNPLLFHLTKARRLLPGSPEWNAFKTYFAPKVSEVLQSIVAEEDSSVGAKMLFLTQLVELACQLEDPFCIDYATKLFEEWKAEENPAENNPISPLLRPAVYCAAISAPGSNTDNFNFALERFNDSNASPTTRRQLLTALGCRAGSSLVLLDSLTKEGVIPKEYAEAALQSVIANPLSRDPALAYLDEYFWNIFYYLDLDLRSDYTIYVNAVNSLSSYYSSQSQFDEITDFIDSHLTTASDPEDIQTLVQALSTLENNIDWMGTFGIPMGKWLSENS